MPLQYITDNTGAHTAVVIPIHEWEKLTRKHEDLKTLEETPTKPKVKLSELEGKLSHETAEAMLNYVAESRNGWKERLKNNFRTDVFIGYQRSNLLPRGCIAPKSNALYT